MSRRHRVDFQATPAWRETPATRDPVDLERAEPRTPIAPEPVPSRRSGRRTALLAAATGVALAVAGLAVVRSDPAPAPRQDDARDGPSFEAPGSEERVFVDASEVLASPLRGSVNRYWATADDQDVARAHVFALGPLDPVRGGPEAVLVVDATRRAKVLPASEVMTVGDAVVRVMDDDRGVRVLEWDLDGWGVSLTAVHLDLVAARRVVAAVAAPPGDSLLSGRSPLIDDDLLAEAGLVRTDSRSAPAAISGGPLVGQAGLDSVEAYAYRTVPEVPAGFVVTASIAPTVRAEDLAALGPLVQVITGWPTAGRAVGLELRTETPVAFRVTGTTRIVFDHPAGVTFWIASDQLTLPELLRAGDGVDFDRIALRLTRT